MPNKEYKIHDYYILLSTVSCIMQEIEHLDKFLFFCNCSEKLCNYWLQLFYLHKNLSLFFLFAHQFLENLKKKKRISIKNLSFLLKAMDFFPQN